MEISNLYERVLLAQFAYHYVNQAALGILGTIAVTAFIYDAIRGVLGAGTTHLRNLAGRLILSLVALGLYPRIVRTAKPKLVTTASIAYSSGIVAHDPTVVVTKWAHMFMWFKLALPPLDNNRTIPINTPDDPLSPWFPRTD